MRHTNLARDLLNRVLVAVTQIQPSQKATDNVGWCLSVLEHDSDSGRGSNTSEVSQGTPPEHTRRPQPISASAKHVSLPSRLRTNENGLET